MHIANYVPIYVLVRCTMKNAARCDTHCELYDSVNQLNLEHVRYCRNVSERLSASVETIFALRTNCVMFVHVNAVIDVTACKWQADCVVGMCVVPCNIAISTACPAAGYTSLIVRDIVHELNWHDHMHTIYKHEIMLAHPPNLSILISGGKCTTLNAFSHCEWTRIKSQLETMIRSLNCCICM